MKTTGNRAQGSIRLQPISTLEEREAVMRAISQYELAKSDAWRRLKDLPRNTTFDAADAVPEGFSRRNLENLQPQRLST